MHLEDLLKVKAHSKKPLKIVHCGSTRKAREAFEQWRLEDTLCGHIVLTIGAHKNDDDLHIGPELAVRLDVLHLWKIEEADCVRVLNVGGYIGESTRREVEYALRLKKQILFLEPDTRLCLPGIPCSACEQDAIEVHPCAYCGALVCQEHSFTTDMWDMKYYDIPLGRWMCIECGCK